MIPLHPVWSQDVDWIELYIHRTCVPYDIVQTIGVLFIFGRVCISLSSICPISCVWHSFKKKENKTSKISKAVYAKRPVLTGVNSSLTKVSCTAVLISCAHVIESIHVDVLCITKLAVSCSFLAWRAWWICQGIMGLVLSLSLRLDIPGPQDLPLAL